MRLRTTDASETWRALLTAFSSVQARLADEMEELTGLPLEHYEILLMLARAEAGEMRPSDIAAQRRLSRSGATRLVDRLVADGLVERRRCDEDGRGSLVGLTATGEELFRTAGRLHLRGIEEHVGSHLDADEMAELRRLLGALGDAPRP